MEKITFSEGVKMCRGTGHMLWHLKWYPPLEREHPDCSHFVVQGGKDYRDAKITPRGCHPQQSHRTPS